MKLTRTNHGVRTGRPKVLAESTSVNTSCGYSNAGGGDVSISLSDYPENDDDLGTHSTYTLRMTPEEAKALAFQLHTKLTAVYEMIERNRKET